MITATLVFVSAIAILLGTWGVVHLNKYCQQFRAKGYSLVDALLNTAATYVLLARLHISDPAKRASLIKNIIIIAGALTIGMMIAPTKAIGVLVTKMPCLDHDNCIVTTIQEFDV